MPEISAIVAPCTALDFSTNLMNKTRKLRALIVGAPGSGKGTQTSRIIKKFPSIKHFQSGDFIRNHLHGPMAELIKAGHLIPTNLIIKEIFGQLSLIKDNCFLLDGFPRSMDQMERFEGFLRENNIEINMVINLNVDKTKILDRIKNRLIHEGSGRTYNLSFNPPKVKGLDDITGEPLTRRSDDDVDTFRKRLVEYEKLTFPLIDYYDKKGVMVEFKGNSSDEISPLIFNHLEMFYSK